MMVLRLLFFPVAGMLIGWLTGWILSRRVIHVALNKRRAGLAEQLATYVSSKMISSDLILEQVAKPGPFIRLMPVIEHHIDDFLRNRLKTAIPMIGMLIGERTITQLKTVFMQELEVIFPEVLNKYATDLVLGLDYRTEIANRLAAIPAADLEAILKPVLGKLFCLVGLLSGFITGLANILIYFLCF